MARVLVTGTTGYIGGRLVPVLVHAGHTVRCLARTPAKLDGMAWRDEVEVVAGDVTDRDSLRQAFHRIDAAYYLIHSIGGDPSWEALDRRAAAALRDAAAAASIGQIVYLGGLGTGSRLSAHLSSRQEIGEILRSGQVPVTELRAAVIVGSGSTSFEMLRHLVETLPVMVTPRWVSSRCQPIAIGDVLAYLVGVLGNDCARGRVFEIGGPDVLTYLDMMREYVQVAGLPRRLIVPVPVLSPRLSSLWIGLVTPLPPSLARPLVNSLVNDVVVHDRAIGAVVPHDCLAFRSAVALALEEGGAADGEVARTGSEGWAGPAGPLPTDPPWAGGTVLEDRRTVVSSVAPHRLFGVVEGIGGDRGWYGGRWLWTLRGVIDRLVGGVGPRRGRRHADRLRIDDVVDTWRVEAIEPDRLLRLRSEMRLPGRAWLEWRVEREGSGSRLEQRARFVPRGLLGRCYWYLLVPVHVVIFRRLARRLAAAAESSKPLSASLLHEEPESSDVTMHVRRRQEDCRRTTAHGR